MTSWQAERNSYRIWLVLGDSYEVFHKNTLLEARRKKLWRWTRVLKWQDRSGYTSARMFWVFFFLNVIVTHHGKNCPLRFYSNHNDGHRHPRNTPLYWRSHQQPCQPNLTALPSANANELQYRVARLECFTQFYMMHLFYAKVLQCLPFQMCKSWIIIKIII